MPSSRRDGFRVGDVAFDEACAILGGTPLESEGKLTKRYRSLMRDLHTDRTGKDATEQLKRVTMAHKIVKNVFDAVRKSDLRYDIPDPQALNERIAVATPTELSELVRKAAENVDPSADFTLDSYLDCVRDDPVAKWDPRFLELMLGRYIEGPVTEALQESGLLDAFDPKERRGLTEMVERAVVFEATANAMQGFTYCPVTKEARHRIPPAQHMDRIIRMDASLGMGIGYDRVAATRRLADVTVKRLMEHVHALQNLGEAEAERAATEARAQERLARIMRPRHETDEFTLATSAVAADVLRHYMKSSDPAEWVQKAHLFMGGPLSRVLSAIQFEEPVVRVIQELADHLAWTPGVRPPPQVAGVTGNDIGNLAVFEAGVAQAVRAGVELGLAGVNVQTTQVPAFLQTCEAEMRGAARRGTRLVPGEWTGDQRGGIFKGPWARDWGQLVASSLATMADTAVPDFEPRRAQVLDDDRRLGAGAIRLALPPGEGWKPSLPAGAKVVEPNPSVGAMPQPGMATVDEPVLLVDLDATGIAEEPSIAEALGAHADRIDAFRDPVESWRPAPPPGPSSLPRPFRGRRSISPPAVTYGNEPVVPRRAPTEEDPLAPRPRRLQLDGDLPAYDAYEGARPQTSMWGRLEDIGGKLGSPTDVVEDDLGRPLDAPEPSDELEL